MCVGQIVEHAKLSPFQIDHEHSKAAWKSNRHALQIIMPGISSSEPAETKDLTLPKIDVTARVPKKDLWKMQTYARFAEQLQGKNPNSLLSKNIVDAAFRLAVTRMGSYTANLLGRESAIARIRRNSHCNGSDYFAND